MNELTQAFKTSVCSSIELEPLGKCEYLVHTGFTYSDGDEFHIVLNIKEGEWMLSDEGHTFMWLAYENFSWTETREDLLRRIINSNSVMLDGDQIKIQFRPDEAGSSLYSLIQAMAQVSDLRVMSVDRVMNTFIEDMKEWFRSSEFAKRCKFGEEIKTPKGAYSTDVLIEGKIPIVVLGVTNVLRCKDAIITMLGLSETGQEYRFLVAIDEYAEIPLKDKSMLINRADRPIMGMDAENVAKYIKTSDAESQAFS